MGNTNTASGEKNYVDMKSIDSDLESEFFDFVDERTD